MVWKDTTQPILFIHPFRPDYLNAFPPQTHHHTAPIIMCLKSIVVLPCGHSGRERIIRCEKYNAWACDYCLKDYIEEIFIKGKGPCLCCEMNQWRIARDEEVVDYKKHACTPGGEEIVARALDTECPPCWENPGNETKAAHDRSLNPSKAQFAPMTSASTSTQSGATTRPSRPFDPFDKPGEAPREYTSRNTQECGRDSAMRDTQRGTQGESRRDTQRGTEARRDSQGTTSTQRRNTTTRDQSSGTNRTSSKRQPTNERPLDRSTTQSASSYRDEKPSSRRTTTTTRDEHPSTSRMTTSHGGYSSSPRTTTISRNEDPSSRRTATTRVEYRSTTTSRDEMPSSRRTTSTTRDEHTPSSRTATSPDECTSSRRTTTVSRDGHPSRRQLATISRDEHPSSRQTTSTATASRDPASRQIMTSTSSSSNNPASDRTIITTTTEEHSSSRRSTTTISRGDVSTHRRLNGSDEYYRNARGRNNIDLSFSFGG